MSLLEKYKKVRGILIKRNENNESLYLCNITWNIMQDEELYDDLTDRLLVYRSLEKIVPCSKNVRNIKHSYCDWVEKEFQQRLDFVNSIIKELQ